MATAGPFRFRVLLAMRGIPAHLWSLGAAQRILGPSCTGLELASVTANQENMEEYLVAAWCIHPDFIPAEMIVAVPETDVPFFVEPPLFLRQHEMIRSEMPGLRYLVRIRNVEGLYWRTPTSTSDDDQAGDSNEES